MRHGRITSGVFAAGIAVIVMSLPARGAEPLNGGQLFQENCAACHQAHGEGIPGAFPSLAGDTFVQSAPAQVAALVVNGRNGMPAFKGTLSDGQIAAILTHVRANWGNRAGPVDPAVVAAARAGR